MTDCNSVYGRIEQWTIIDLAISVIDANASEEARGRANSSLACSNRLSITSAAFIRSSEGHFIRTVLGIYSVSAEKNNTRYLLPSARHLPVWY